MSVAAAIAAVESLRPDQKQFLAERRVRSSMPASRWCESLKQVVELGPVTLPASRFCRNLGCFGIAVAVVAIVASFKAPWLGLPALVLGAAAVAWARWKGAQLLGAGQGPFVARVEKLLLPCVRIFQRDMDAEQPLRLEVDLRSDLGERVGAPRQLPGPFKNKGLLKVVEKDYRKPLLAGQARLADGSVLSWRVLYDLRVREITKRGASGKTKRKVKTRGRRLVAARLGLRTGDWSLAAAPAAGQAGAGAGITTTANERRLVLKVRRTFELGKAFDLAKAAPEDGLEDLLATIGSLYAQVSRRPAAAAREGQS
ncbi:MAG TPA: hypothetical protein VMW75_27465 [Thermoanaerobaculia bacterium]|nr:hypothetical protein [Thermoanaerobaculia bacterium]